MSVGRRRRLWAYLERSICESEDDSVEDDCADDDVGALPAVVFDEERAKRSENERSDARTADRHAGRQRPLLVEVVTDHDD